MNIEDFRSYCLAKPAVEESFPFDEYTLVFKVAGKMFAATGLKEEIFRVNLKCDPERALELRETYAAIIPGYHMNKKHWNTIVVDELMDEQLFAKLIDHSYELVIASLTKKLRLEFDLEN